MYRVVFLLSVVGAVGSAPNFLVVLTDDQDLLLDGLVPMNETLRLLADEGAALVNAFANSPICCPSRSTILTGKYLHNTGVLNNSLSGNCCGGKWQQELEPFAIAPLLKEAANYTTFYAGKYLNQYGSEESGGTKYVPKGYDWWVGLKGNSKYYNYTLSVNGTVFNYELDYLTDVLKNFSLDFLKHVSTHDTPFFMIVAPPAPHAPFTPAPRHEDTFPNVKAIRTPSFNHTPTDKHWLVKMPPQSLPSDVTILDDIQRHRMQALLAVDELVESLISSLEHLNVLNETYVIYTSDNGFHIGQFTQPWDKRQPYETDIRVPFLIRGPNIPKKSLIASPFSLVDLAPTLLDLAGISVPNDMDGSSFKDKLLNVSKGSEEEGLVLVEYVGEGDASRVDERCPWSGNDDLTECTLESWCKCQDSRNNSYACIVNFDTDVTFKYCQFVDGNNFVEAYDLRTDPFELRNIYGNMLLEEDGYYRRLLNGMYRCKGLNCRNV